MRRGCVPSPAPGRCALPVASPPRRRLRSGGAARGRRARRRRHRALGVGPARARRAVLLRPAGPVRQRRPAQRHAAASPATGSRTGYDPTDKGFYHGGDLKGVIDKLDYIQGLGTTAIWLAPVFKNRPVQGSGGDVSAGYHGYWITDFTQVDPHFGTNADLKRLVRLAHQRGMKIYLDIIVNHTADVIQYAENKYAYIDKATAPYTRRAGPAVRGPQLRRRAATASRRSTTTSFPYTPVFADRGRRDGQGPGLAERPDHVPQPRRLDLRRGEQRVRRLLRPRRPVDRASRGGPAA